MRLSCRFIPSISVSVPWIGRSIPWNFRSMGTFQQKIGPDLCHIVAKSGLCGFPAAGLRGDVSVNQMLLFFAHLRATARLLENNRFSVLKFCPLRPFPPAGGGWRFRNMCTSVRGMYAARYGFFRYLCFAKIGCGSAKSRKSELSLASALAFRYLTPRQTKRTSHAI